MNRSVLYGIIRVDVPDMTNGKAAAQLMHGANEFDAYVNRYQGECDGDFIKHYSEWRGDGIDDTRRFGVTLTVTSDLKYMQNRLVPFVPHMGWVHDSTYPYKGFDGRTYTMPIDTAMWAFLTPDCPSQAWSYIECLPLMP